MQRFLWEEKLLFISQQNGLQRRYKYNSYKINISRKPAVFLAFSGWKILYFRKKAAGDKTYNRNCWVFILLCFYIICYNIRSWFFFYEEMYLFYTMELNLRACGQ